MDIIDHLVDEHRKAEQMMHRLGSTEPGPERNRLVDELIDVLNTHMAVEERFVYPIVAETQGEEPETGAENEHELAREGLAKLDELRDEPGFGAAVDMLEAGIGHHVREEESTIFPQLRRDADASLVQLDPAVLEARVRADRATRDDLYARARAAEIPGRSSMTKDELAAAVADAS